MTEAIAIISILSGAAVAIAVPVISARLERSRMEQQNQRARTEELRAILDNAVQHLMSARALLLDAEQLLIDFNEKRNESDPKPVLDLGEALKHQADVLVQDGIRIQLRTPKGAQISVAHGKGENAFTRFEYTYRAFLRDSVPLPQRDLPLNAARDRTMEITNALEGFVEEIRVLAGVG